MVSLLSFHVQPLNSRVMTNTVINFAIGSCRKALLEQIKRELLKNGDKEEISIELGNGETIRDLFLGHDGEPRVRATFVLRDNFKEEYFSLSDCYSLDEIIKIIDEI